MTAQKDIKEQLGRPPARPPDRLGRAHVGPYGPIWALMGPYGPIWAHMGPIWILLDRSGHDPIKTFGPISHVSGPEIVF